MCVNQITSSFEILSEHSHLVLLLYLWSLLYFLSGSSPSTQLSNAGLRIIWGVDNLFVSPSMFFWGNSTHIHSLNYPIHYDWPHISISSPELFSELCICILTSYHASPLECLKFSISKLSILKFSIYKNQGIDLSPKIWFYLFAYLSEPFRTKSSIWTITKIVCHWFNSKLKSIDYLKNHNLSPGLLQ